MKPCVYCHDGRWWSESGTAPAPCGDECKAQPGDAERRRMSDGEVRTLSGVSSDDYAKHGVT